MRIEPTLHDMNIIAFCHCDKTSDAKSNENSYKLPTIFMEFFRSIVERGGVGLLCAFVDLFAIIFTRVCSL